MASFVPWHVVETDISHRLFKFLQAAAQRKMTVSLIVSPELGIHYTNSGLPKDFVTKKENTAIDSKGAAVLSHLPPNSFQVPSLFSVDFSKRYYSFLSRVDTLMADFGRSEEGILEGVTLVLTGSFWKYYRSAKDSTFEIFGGRAGDFSNTATLAYRQRLEQFINQKEFQDPSPASAARWKHRSLEETHQRWFFQQSEEVFRVRSHQMLRRKVANVRLQDIELYTPEADPGYFYSSFLQTLTGGRAQFSRISEMLDEMASRASMATEGPAVPFVHWSAMGGFDTLSDPEKQFLILKSILLMAGRRGGILVDESEWFTLSANFRSKAEALARTIGQGDLELANRVLYLAPHLWSSSGLLWAELLENIGPGARMISSTETLSREKSANLLVVDPKTVFTRELVLKLLAWAKMGRVLVLPRSPLYSEAARSELEAALSVSPRMELQLGVSYRLHALGGGKVIVYDLPEGQAVREEMLSAWQKFVGAILAISQIKNVCAISDQRVSVISMRKKNSSIGLFVMNSSRRPVTADLIFPQEVSVSDLAQAFAGAPVVESDFEVQAEDASYSDKFSLQVPSFGILPLAVSSRFEERIDLQPLTSKDSRATSTEATWN
ncbi:MAG: hypothetical protein AABZ55_04210 [Bdellovibrionota bacterium]